MEEQSFDMKKYTYWLSSFLPQELQNEAISKILININENNSTFLIPEINSPSTWNNILSILKEVKYPRNKGAIKGITHLLVRKDWIEENKTILKDVIQEMYFNAPCLVMHSINDAIYIAKKDLDYEWLHGLKWIIRELGIDYDIKKLEI